MFLKIFLFCSFVVVVSTNPVATVMRTPAATYPSYQQSNYRIPLDNINPCVQLNTGQNQATLQGYTIPSNFKQILLNRFLSKPYNYKQTVLEPDVYGANEVEIPNVPVVSPNLVSNYVIVPVDYSNIDKTILNGKVFQHDTGNVNNDPNQESTRKRSRNKCKRKRVKNNSKKRTSSSGKINRENYEYEIPKKKTKNTSRVTLDNKRDTNTNKKNKNVQDTTNNVKNKKRKQRESKGEISDRETYKDIHDTTQKPRRRRKPKLDESINHFTKNNAVKHPYREKTSNGTALIKHRKEINGERTNIKSINVPNAVNNNKIDNNSIKNPRNMIINDFLRTFPSIPEEMAKSILGGLNQFSDLQLKNFFGSYEQIYQSLKTSSRDNLSNIDKRSSRRKKTRKSRRHRNKKKKNQKNKTLLSERNTFSSPLIYENIVESELISTDTEVTVTKDTRKYENPFENTTYTFTNFTDDKYQETEHYGLDFHAPDDRIEELPLKVYTDDNAPATYYGWIDDYYPLFTDDATYNANNKEVYIQKLNEDQYFYTRDRQANLDDVNKHAEDDCILPERDTDEGEINKYTYKNIEDESITSDTNIIKDRPIGSEEVHFRSPPFLELPDFRTRKIDSSEIKMDRQFYTYDDLINTNSDFSDKASSYSDVKTFCNKGKQNVIKSPTKDGANRNDIETVFAKSKVAKYGVLSSSEEDDSYPSNIGNARQDFQKEGFQIGGTTYILAKSLSVPEEIW